MIGINRDLSSGLEAFLGDMNYEKLAVDNFAYVKYETESKEIPEVASYLELHAGEPNFAYIRLGDRADDIECYGDLDKFDMVVNRSVEIE
jgi:hypothetical protein